MIGLVSVGLIFMTVFWIGRFVERQHWVTGRNRMPPVMPACPYCRIRTGFQCIRVEHVEISAVCRRCLRRVDHVRVHAR